MEETQQDTGIPVSKQELENVLRKMLLYRRENGYMAHIAGTLMFFDGWIEGGCYVTQDDLKRWIENY